MRWDWGERMNVWDILILLAVAGMVLLAVRAIRSGKAGGCHDCASCGGNCAACHKPCAEKKRG